MTVFKPRVIQKKVSELVPYANNAKVHPPKQIKLIKRSYAEFGVLNPILADAKNVIVAGHGRYEAAIELGLETVPVIVIDHLTPVQVNAYRLIDNRSAEFGTSWSFEKLQLEVATIVAENPAFDVEDIGFSMREIELSLDSSAAADDASEPPIPEVVANAVTRLGDIWRIGEHLLICGDATDAATYTALLAKERARMVFADAPYGVKIQGHVSGKGKVKHREFVMGTGEHSDPEFIQFLANYMLHCRRYSRAGSLHYHCIDWAHVSHLLAAANAVYDEYKNLCVWTKSNAGMGSLYRSQHEFIGVFKKGGAAHVNNVELGKNGRNRSNVWPYAGMNSFSAERDEALSLHPTVKPLALVRDAILDASRRGDIVLDPFGGSGTTLLAADAVGRVARLIELDPLYCDVIVRRAEQALGVSATLAETGQTFAVIAAQRETDHV